MPSRLDRVAIVLSAGGVRGAYQVGVIQGIIEILGLHGGADTPLFDVYTGTSVGAINAAYLASHADRADYAIDGLVKIWSELDVDEILHFSLLSLLRGWPRRSWRGALDPGCPEVCYVGRSLFDPRPLEALLERRIDWDRLHANIGETLVRAVVVGALDITEGCTHFFAELAPGVRLRPDPDPTPTLVTPVTAERVLASVAMPFVFPALRIDNRHYMDGGIRFSAPIAPALRADADRVVVISLLHGPPEPVVRRHEPSLAFLIGQISSAVLLHPVIPSLQDLRHTNQIFAALAETVDRPVLNEVTRKLESEHVLAARAVPTLVFQPSEDIAMLTATFLREEFAYETLGPLWRMILHGAKNSDAGHQALLASILFLDGRLASRLIDLGRRDACAARERILEFFDG